jgi:hypothetical protein
METRYLRQIGTNKAPFPWTEALAKRKDMVPYSPKEAKIRIEANRRMVEEMKEGKKMDPVAKAEAKAQAEEIAKTVKELAATEQEIEDMKFNLEEVPKDTDSPAVKTKREHQMENDRDLAKIRAMTRKAHVEEYLAQKYGREFDSVEITTTSLKDLKDIAIKARIGTLYEVPDDKLK